MHLADGCSRNRREAEGRKTLLPLGTPIGRQHGFDIQVFGETGGFRWASEQPNQLIYTPVGGRTQIIEKGESGLYEDAKRLSRVAIAHPEGFPLAVANIYCDLADAIRGLPALGFAGCNITIPHKVHAMAMMDVVHPVAQRMGAINTIVVQADGSLHGFNNDGFGYIQSLRDAKPDWRGDAGPVLVLGAGGAAAARAGAAGRGRAAVPRGRRRHAMIWQAGLAIMRVQPLSRAVRG